MKNVLTYKRELSLAALILVAACGDAIDRPLHVDGPQNINFVSDERECRELARNFSDGREKGAATAGAVLGGLVGAAEADKGDTVTGAVVGAALGGLIGNAEAGADLDEERRNVMIRCMQNRGHSVIG